MRRTRNAKIIATLGPAVNTMPRIAELFMAGADVFRLNFSHGTHDEHFQRYQMIRKLEKDSGRPIAVLMDLQGPKLRVADFHGGETKLTPGNLFRLDSVETPGNSRRVRLPHPEIFECLEPGANLLLDDGKLRLRVERCGKDYAETMVINGGVLSDRKGVNVPDAVLPLSVLTEKDRCDLEFGLKMGVDWVALSFVQKPSDVLELRELVGDQAKIMAKLEKPSAIRQLDRIVHLSDAIMVARGDLGVELPPEDVPGLQKRIIRTCLRKGKPVVVATQMLDSMVHAPTPTRAEASDVATAVFDGADAVMLSAETASGDYPLESVSLMDRIIRKAENNEFSKKLTGEDLSFRKATTADAITAAASQAAETISASAIVTFSTSGSTTSRMAKERPSVPILGLTPNEDTARYMSLVWGVHSVEIHDVKSFSDVVATAERVANEEEFTKSGDRIIVTAGVPFGVPGTTNALRILDIE
ncbi:MAG: pyruvate kinase [Alphaproteobacteria bacterium]|nr:pyruvate kinase [Rhodospirillales bacterium]MCW9045131.1 pyruvate kinase [Alphaproteobacteria bacterium]